MLKKEFREIFTAEIISITGGLVAGILLVGFIDQILLIPGLLILLPGFLEMRGNISGSLAARLSTALHLRQIRPTMKSKFVAENLLATFAQALIVSIVLATIAYLVTYFVFGYATLAIFVVAIVAALVADVIEANVTAITTLWLFKKGHDPNNIMGPYVTTTGDIISIISLLIGIIVVAWL